MHSLSIITVNYNNEQGLKKTLGSLSMQDYTGFEHIIVDGGSKDGSYELIESYSAKNAQRNYFVKWISESDNGVFQAMNKGIRMATGEYLLFMNSGDFFENKEVLTQVFTQKHYADFLCGRAKIIRNGELLHITNPPEKHTFSTYYKRGINHQATFIKRRMFSDFGMYREDFKINADWEFWIRTIILNNCSTKKLDNIICEYNLDGISSQPKEVQKYQYEITEVLSNPLLQKFVPDYENWYKQRAEMNTLLWVKSKGVLYQPLLIIYKLARFLNG